MKLRCLPILLAAATATAPALDVGFHGQASAWLAGGRDTALFGLAGLRYLPKATLSVPLPGRFTLDAEVSVSARADVAARERESVGVEVGLKPYRLLARVSAERFEARVGLQKSNFGSATLLRPLQWFDRLDPRDPLGLTDGVYGLLLRGYPWGNANVWAWGLLGNHEPGGLAALPTVRWKPELGGRAQLPVPRGEVALTYHHRVVDYREVIRIPELLDEQAEDRVGLDGKWDVGIGFWVEGMLARETFRMSHGEGAPLWTRAGTVGADYTFGIGSGLNAVVEHLSAGRTTGRPFAAGDDRQFSALALSYPLGLLDNLRAIAYVDWTSRAPHAFLAWQRTTDRLVLSVALFAGPVRADGAGPVSTTAGQGLRFDVAFNH